MAWYDNAVFYHIYPLGLCGCAHENDGQAVPGAFNKLNAWAEHAADIGCTAIYIGPLFESGSHGYDTIDYRLVDRRLGTNAEFKDFVARCHARGQKVIVDGVFNHVGRDFFAFQDLKANRENARYKDWFCDVNFWGNNEYNDGFSYGNWGGFNLLVKLNQRNPEVQNYHYDTIRFWVDEFDIDGIRLDAADVLDFDFMRGLRRLANEVKPEFWLMGEVIHGDYSRWANPEMLHSVTNYELHKGLWSGHNDHNYFEIAHTMRRLQGLCHDTRLYLFSDNHDVERLPNKLRNREHIRHIAILVYTLWGIPSIYYGSEFGIEGKKEWGSDWPLRPCLELSDFKDAETTNPVTSVYAALGRLKAELPELTRSSVVRADKVRKDLRNALAKGHYPNACMNEAETTLYLDETMYHPAPAAAPVQPKAAQPALTDEELFRRDGADFLNYLKNSQGRLGDQADEELVQMRKTCAAIMGFVHNHPEQLPRVRRYREYYMPTTRKLLNTALGLGESATQNAQEIRRDIVGILHTLNTAYEKLYDTLLQDVSMDVSTEIDTLEAMLNQDGLTHDFAADFGAK